MTGESTASDRLRRFATDDRIDEPRGSVELEQVQTQQQVNQYAALSVQRLRLISRVSPQELEFQETLIAEREAEIRDIETGIHELNDIFRDLGTIVEQQGGLIGEFSVALCFVRSD